MLEPSFCHWPTGWEGSELVSHPRVTHMGALSYHQKTIQKEINGPVAVKNYMSTVNSLLQEHMEHGTIQNTNKPKDLFLNWLSVTDKKCLIHACRLIVSVLTVSL